MGRAGADRTAAKLRRSKHRVLLLERILPIGLLAVALIGAPLMVFSRDGMPRLEAVEQELRTVERENAELRREIDVLRARVNKLRDDPAAVEQLARDELGLIRHSEIVFQFPK
jgi:cell division protein FtsB